jgi:hypothetical protein
MAVIKIHKVTALPASLDGHAVYLVAPAAKPNYVEMYVTNADGTVTKRVINSDDIQAMIDASIAAAGSNVTIVNTITDRDALTKHNGMYVLVLDATGDPTVTSGSASYVWRDANSSWIKLTEYESLDLQLTWDKISGKPSSTPSQIDSSVANSHTHSNMTQLGKVGEDANGDFTYGGNPPRARLETAGW